MDVHLLYSENKPLSKWGLITQTFNLYSKRSDEATIAY